MRPPGTALPTPIIVDNEHYQAVVVREGYVSGVKAGSFLDKKTGARDLGFGLSIVDFLLEPEPADKPESPRQYEFGPGHPYHGEIPKRYVEGPQICTKARQLDVQQAHGDNFTTLRMAYHWHESFPPRVKAGSAWEQTLVFPKNERFFLSADRVTTVSQSPEMFLRIDMPGHIKHTAAMEFEHVYLSYHSPTILPSTEFSKNFPPDARFLYRRDDTRVPERFIRAYQVNLPDGREGPWLAGMTLNPADVYQAWCHERGYVCMIEELGGRATKPGDTFGACYLIGWFDDVPAMEQAYDRYKGWSGLAIEGPSDKPTGFRGLRQNELPALETRDAPAP